jgi:hypothetical protein
MSQPSSCADCASYIFNSSLPDASRRIAALTGLVGYVGEQLLRRSRRHPAAQLCNQMRRENGALLVKIRCTVAGETFVRSAIASAVTSAAPPELNSETAVSSITARIIAGRGSSFSGQLGSYPLGTSKRTGREVGDRNTCPRIWGSSASGSRRRLSRRSSNRFTATRISMRAKCIPRQTCAP